MSEQLQPLILALRDELQQYGELLALLDQQQERVAARASDDVLQSVVAIQAQSRVIQQARNSREECRIALARALGQEASASFATLLPLLPSDYRPLLEALVEENNSLLGRIQQRARQNHLLLTRMVDLFQQLISAFLPARQPKLYTEHGHMLRLPVVQPLYEAVG